MKEILQIITLVLTILSINGLPNCTTENINPTLIHNTIEILDTFCDSEQYGWYVSPPSRDDKWFFYFDNLTDVTSSSHADEFFRNVSETSNFTLSNFGGVDGVWVAYYSQIPPDFKEPNPVIILPKSHLLRNMEMLYYIHKNATIRIGNTVLKRRLTDTQEDQWMRFYKEGVGSLTIELLPQQEGEFVLIDRIVLRPPEVTTPSSEPSSEITTNPTPEPSSSTTTSKIPTTDFIDDDETTPPGHSGQGAPTHFFSRVQSLALLLLYLMSNFDCIKN